MVIGLNVYRNKYLMSVKNILHIMNIHHLINCSIFHFTKYKSNIQFDDIKKQAHHEHEHEHKHEYEHSFSAISFVDFNIKPLLLGWQFMQRTHSI